MGHAVILLNNNGIQRSNLEGQRGLALVAVEGMIFLGGGFLHLETGAVPLPSRCIARRDRAAALLMEPDLALWHLCGIFP